MARIRTIKPDFFRSRTIDKLTLEQRLTFIGLWTHCDDEGRCEYDPRLVKADVWPLSDRTAHDVETDIQALTEHSLISHYVVGERSYLQVNGWREHQKINRPTPSKLPSPESGQISPLTCGDESSLNAHGGVTEDSPPERNKEQGKECASAAPPQPPQGTHREDVEQLCTRMLERLQGNDVKASITKQWREEARRLLDVDERDLEQALRLIDWATQHEFWSSNIHSVPKFRKQFDKLRMQAQQDPNWRHLRPVGSVADEDIDPDEILGPDYWSPPSPPREIADGPHENRLEWLRERRAERRAERVAEARRMLAARQERGTA